jgi:type I restriction enzyme R subunit
MVVITTIQRLYAMLRGEELDESAEEASSFETWSGDGRELPPIGYNPAIPIEQFDFIVTDGATARSTDYGVRCWNFDAI